MVVLQRGGRDANPASASAALELSIANATADRHGMDPYRHPMGTIGGVSSATVTSPLLVARKTRWSSSSFRKHVFFARRFGSMRRRIRRYLRTRSASRNDPPKSTHPRRRWLQFWRVTERDFGCGERVFDQGIVHRPKDPQPSSNGSAASVHLQRMAERPCLFIGGDDLVPVVAIETDGLGEAKLDGAAGRIRFDAVANRAMPTGGANAQRAIELHPRPRMFRPQGVFA